MEGVCAPSLPALLELWLIPYKYNHLISCFLVWSSFTALSFHKSFPWGSTSHGQMWKVVGQILNFVPVSNSTTDADGNPLDAEAEAARLRDIEAVTNATGGRPVIIERTGAGFKPPGT